MPDDPAPTIVIYDGVCGFCDRSVNWLMQIDRKQRFRYAALQGTTAAAIRQRHPEIPATLDSIILVEGDLDLDLERVSWHSAAVLRILEIAGIDTTWTRLAKRVPRPILDVAYRLFAMVRYRVFGRLDECRVPTEAERSLFLP